MTDRTAFEAHFKLTQRQQSQHKDGSYKDELTQARWEGYQVPAQYAARYRWLQDWYLRGGKRSEIDPHGHVRFTTTDIMDAAIDAAMPAQELRPDTVDGWKFQGGTEFMHLPHPPGFGPQLDRAPYPSVLQAALAAQGERVTVCPTLDRECGEYYGGWCATCPKARTKAQVERQPKAWLSDNGFLISASQKSVAIEKGGLWHLGYHRPLYE